MTPSEIGTIIDEKVDINDIVAEITELARLKIIEIIKLDKKGIFGKKDYAFVDISDAKKLGKLEKHQRLIFDSIFELTNLTDTDDVIKRLGDKYGNSQVVLLSSLSQKFYTSLNKIKKELYERMSEKKYFDGNPEKVKGKYIAIAVLVNTLASIAVFSLGIYTYNFVPVAILVFGFIVSIIIAFAMPRRSAHGYSLKRNTEGLKHYLNVGKWRQEIAEKNLFAEMLPMAISLGVVNQLAKDMESLKIEPPKYMHGFVVSSFARDFANFSSQTTRNLVSTPPGTNVSGHSSWSGGSGFSGGGGGGFGGGGGGSW